MPKAKEELIRISNESIVVKGSNNFIQECLEKIIKHIEARIGIEPKNGCGAYALKSWLHWRTQ